MRAALLQLAEEANLPLTVDFPNFFVLKGIEGNFNFKTRKTTINQLVINSMDPKRIIATAVKSKRSLYDSPFEPQSFINTLMQYYKNIVKKENHVMGDGV